MLCFGHDFSGDPLSKTHLMRLFAKDNRVLWINSIGYRAPTISSRDIRRIVTKLKAFLEPVREVEPNLFVLNPLAVPAYGVVAVQKLNRVWLRRQVRRAMKGLGFQRVINWVFNPTAAVVAGELGEDLVVYYCVDEFTAFSGIAPQLIELERGLIERADLVIVSSETLRRSKSYHNPRTVMIRHGVDWEHYQKTFSADTRVPTDVAGLPKPVLGYFGLMAEDWFDLDLVVDVARRFSSGSVVLLGKVDMDLSPLRALPNVHVLGRKAYAELPSYCKAFDVALNPFPVSAVSRSANPLKVREYLAAGLPVVSTRIPEVEVLEEVRVVDSSEEFVEAIQEALESPGPRAERAERMKDQRWELKVEEVRRAVGEIVRGRASSR